MSLEEMAEEFENSVKLLRTDLQSNDDKVKEFEEALADAEEALQALRALIKGDY